MRHAERRELLGSAGRFVLAGGLNTLVTGVALALLALVIPPPAAYSIVFAVGIALSTWLAGSFVFRVRMNRHLVVAYVVMYVVVYLIGLAAIAIGERGGLSPSGSGLVVFITAPLTFVGGRLVLRPGRTVPTPSEEPVS